VQKALSPVVVVIIVLVVVIVIAALGYVLVLKPKGGGDGPAEGEMGFEAMEQQMNDPAVQKMQQEQQSGAGQYGPK